MSLILEAVGHHYGGPWVLRGIDLEVAEGDTLAVTGPSGSGKTSLLTILGLLTRPATGRVLIDGRVLTAERADRLRAEAFAWVFQTVNVLGRRSARDNVALGALARGAGRTEALEAASPALRAVGLAEMADRPVHTLSGGELQRVCIARALIERPRFLLADEPTGQLDRSTSDRVAAALFAARHPETAIVVATHDQTIARHCRRVLALVDGRLRRER